jgi:hypothetical protein
MHRWIRNTHLALGLLAVPFVLLYAVSAAQMAHRSWFSPMPEVSVTRLSLPPAEVADPPSLALALMRRGEVKGQIESSSQPPFGYQLRLTRPGTMQDVRYDLASSIAEITTSRSSFIFVLNRLHHLGGVRLKYLPLELWGVVLAGVACVLIALGLTGIYLWFKVQRERLVGSVILAVSLGFSLTLLLLMRLT